MQRKILSESPLIFGEVSMPKGFEINRDILRGNILEAEIKNKELLFSKEWDRLNTYVMENVLLKYEIPLANMKTWGNIYTPESLTEPLLEIDLMDLKNAPDFVLLYGVKVKNCVVKIYYDNNRRKGNSWNIELEDNMFMMFNSCHRYTIENNHKEDLNSIQTITYEYK